MSATPPSRIYPILFFVLLSAGIGALTLRTLTPFLPAIGWAIVLAVALWPLWRVARARFLKHTTLLAVCFSLTAAFVVLLPAALLASALVSQALEVISRVGTEVKGREVTSFSDVIALPGVERPLEWLRAHTGLTPEELQARVVETATRVSKVIAQTSGGVLLGFFNAVMTFVMTMFLLFFFLRDGEGMVEALTALLPLGEEDRRRIMKSLGSMLESIFKGSLVCALVQGVTGAIGWAIAGLPSVALAGAAMAALSLLPIGGTAIVWAPGSAYLWVSGRPGMAIFLVLWGVIATSTLADNVLKPLLIGSGGEMNTLVVFLGVFGGIPAFGLLGVFIGPMTLAVGMMLVKVLGLASRASRAEPAVTSGV